MRIAIVGTGVSGLVVAHLLHRDHEITVFEADDRVGGHTHTVAVPGAAGDSGHAIDTGFIVYNEENYPGFTRLLARLGVPSRASEMSFSVTCERSGIEYGARSPLAMFAQPRNLLRPSHWRMLAEIPRFKARTHELIEGAAAPSSLRLGDFLERHRFSRGFVERFLVPMSAAIWSAEPDGIFDFPAVTLARFFHNHRFLDARGQPRWRTVIGGSHAYVKALIAPFRDRIRLRSPVIAITRHPDRVEVMTRDGARTGASEAFDEVVLATHSDQALGMLADPTDAEKSILGAIPYQPNEVVLHTDTSLMPRRRLAWSSWNYRVPRDHRRAATVTYDMNILQGLESREEYLVTLNDTARIDPRRILRRFVYHHPVFNTEALDAQTRHHEISGVDRTSYCGAYWGYGFHEDGVQSALRVTRRLGYDL